MYLVIGATEMLGAHLLCALLKQGLPVRATKCKCDDIQRTKRYLSYYSSDYDNIFNEIDWVDACAKDLDTMLDAMEGVDVVFDCERPLLSRHRSIQDNVGDIRNKIVAAADAEVGYYYYVSSISALGDEADCKEITEDSQRNPKGNYSKVSQTEYLCEMEVQRAFNEGLKGAIINPGVILGPGDWKTDTSRIFSFALHFPYYTKGVTAFVGVDDVVKSLMAMAKEHICGEKFIIASQCLSYYDVLKYIASSLNFKQPSKYANSFRMLIYKVSYFFKSIAIGRRPLVNDDFFKRLQEFHLFSNSKSLDRIIVDYEPIEQVIQDISEIYKKDNIHTSKKLLKFA